MKCPKCGFNSFETNDACPRCSHDLTSFKISNGLIPLVFPAGVRTTMAETLFPSLTTTATVGERGDLASDLFAFDLPAAQSGKETVLVGDEEVFSFDDPVPPAEHAALAVPELVPAAGPVPVTHTAAVHDPFAGLLETSPGASDSSAFPPSLGSGPDFLSSESVLASSSQEFSWDDLDEPVGEVTSTAKDKFDELFGEPEHKPS